MLLLLFYVGDDRYALESNRVVQILPNLTLKKVYHAPNYVSGLFNYRGQIIPVVDISYLLRDQASPDLLSTRIILVKNQVSAPITSNSPSTTTSSSLLGLRAERVTTTLDLPKTALKDRGMKVEASPYLGKIILDDQGIIQLICPEYLLSEVEVLASPAPSIPLLSGADE